MALYSHNYFGLFVSILILIIQNNLVGYKLMEIKSGIQNLDRAINTNSSNYYSTKDLSEASLLMAKGQKLTGMRREGSTYWFEFTDKKVCEELSNRFWFGECLVNAKTYADALATLKNRIFSRTQAL